MLARTNAAPLAAAGVKHIVTHCPHCLRRLRHEYGHLGGRYEVVHSSELVSDDERDQSESVSSGG